MKNFIKISVTFLTIFVIFPITSLAKEQILPLPKPNVSAEIKKTTAEKKNIYPKKKPKKKSEDTEVESANQEVQIAEVKRSLASTIRIVKAGNIIVLDDEGSYIEDTKREE